MCAATSRPCAASMSEGSIVRPDASTTFWGVSTIASKRSARFSRCSRPSSCPSTSANVVTCSGAWIFGRVRTKRSGRWPASPTSVVRKMSSVRRLRACSSAVSGLTRMPMKGGNVRSRIPRATSRAPAAAWASSSASGRTP